MALTYARQYIIQSQYVEVHVDSHPERDAAMDFLIQLGYQPKGIDPRSFTAGEENQLVMRFVKTAVIADTRQGDKIALDGRYETAKKEE